MQEEHAVEEAARRELQDAIDLEAVRGHGVWDLSTSPPRRAATPKVHDNASYAPPRALMSFVPKARFKDAEDARRFFSTARRRGA